MVPRPHVQSFVPASIDCSTPICIFFCCFSSNTSICVVLSVGMIRAIGLKLWHEEHSWWQSALNCSTGIFFLPQYFTYCDIELKKKNKNNEFWMFTIRHYVAQVRKNLWMVVAGLDKLFKTEKCALSELHIISRLSQ